MPSCVGIVNECSGAEKCRRVEYVAAELLELLSTNLMSDAGQHSDNGDRTNIERGNVRQDQEG